MRMDLTVGLFFLAALTMALAAEDAFAAPATQPERQPGASAAPPTAGSADAPATQVLVSQTQISLYPLSAVSEKLGLAMFVHLQNQPPQRHAACLIDLKTGRITDLSENFSDKPRPNSVPHMSLSPDGGRCLVTIETEKDRLLYVLDLATRKASKLTVPSLGSRPLWCGATRLVLNERRQRGQPSRAKVVDVQGGQITDLPFYGQVLAVDMLGATFAVLANRNDPKQPDAGMRPLAVMILTDQGKVLKTFTNLGERDVRAMSPTGKYLAYLQGRDEDSDSGGAYTIAAVDKGSTWQFDPVPEERILKVSDAGEVITAKEAGVGEHGTTIRYRSASQQRVLGSLWRPVVSGNSLYYLGEGNQSIVRMSLPLTTTDPEESEFRRPQTGATQPAAQSRPAGGPSGAVHGDFKGTAEEFLAEALKDPDVGIMNPPADKDPYGSVGAEEWREMASRAAAQLWLYPDATPAEFNPTLRDRQRGGLWPGGKAGAIGYHRAWYPDGKVMLIEHFTEKGLVWARYYDASGKLLSQIDDGNGLALWMQARRRPGLVRGELRYINGQPANAEGRFDESKYLPATGSVKLSGEHTLSMPWPDTLGLAARALEFVKSQPTSSASSKPASAWSEEGIGTIWQTGRRVYGLRVKDGAMFFSADGGATGRELKPGLDCLPRDLHITADGSIYLWGVAATAHPEKGIPNWIVFSRDQGMTWVKTAAPIDYMVGLDVQDDGTIVVGGRYLPEGGLREGEHWFLLQPWFVMTTRGQRWTKLPHPFGGLLRVVRRIQLANKGGMIYVVQNPGFSDPGSYQVLLCRSLDQPPVMAGGSSDEPEVILAEDGLSFRVLVKGKPLSTTDVRTGRTTRKQP